MFASCLIAYLLIASAVLPLLCGLLGLLGKNSSRANAAVQAGNIAAALMGIAGSAAFLYLVGRGGLAVNFARYLDFSVAASWLPAHFLTADYLAAFFLLAINVGSLLVSWYSISYLPRYRDAYRFPWLHAATGFFLFGMIMTVLAGTVGAFLFAWELMSFSAYFLVIADRKSESLKAGLSYVAMTQIGAACLFAGFAILSKGNLSAPLFLLADGAAPAASLAAFGLLFVGFAAKAGIFPFHEWLPEAHPQAPSSASALMSGVMLKVALYGLMRAAMTVMGFDLPLAAALAVMALGLFTAFYGALMASVETGLKRLLAWSSIENLGLMFATVGLAMLFFAVGDNSSAALAWIGALLLALNHTLFKSGLFMSAGAIIAGTHASDLDDLGGLANRWPGFSKWFLGLVFAGAALPPLGTFYAEWVVLQNAALNIPAFGVPIGASLAIALSAFALAAGLAAFALVKAFASIFLSKPRSEAAAEARPLGAGLVAPVAAAVLLSLAMGTVLPYFLRGVWPSARGWAFSGISVSVGEIGISPLVVAGLLAIGIAASIAFRRAGTKKTVMTDTWDCGAPLTSRMEYTATAFAAPIRNFFRWAAQPWKKMSVHPVSAHNRWIAARSLQHGLRPLAGHYAYRPISRLVDSVSSKVKRLQSGVVQFYLALILVALVLTLIVAL